MTRESWMQNAEERGSFKRVLGGERRFSVVSGTLSLRTGSKIELQGSARALQLSQLEQQQSQKPLSQQSEAPVINSGRTALAHVPTTSHRDSMLGSLKAYYRKLRTFKGTVRALISLKRTPLSLLNIVKARAPTLSSQSEELRSAGLEVARISATAASTVQAQVHKLIAEGHVVAEIDTTSGVEVTYRQQGNLEHYTEDNLAKRVSLQQHPHMIALTQRLWNCALRNGDKKLQFPEYETFMLCLHRLILPEFDLDASKALVMDDWKRDSGEQDQLDYAFFHLSMFELVDLWTDTIDSEDYVSLLYCITHCLTYLLNDRYMLKSLQDVSIVDILEESKGVTMNGIKLDLQRELTSDAFAYHRDQVKLAAEAHRNAGRRAIAPSSPRRESHSQQGGRRRLSIPQSHDHKRLSARNRGRDRNVSKDSESLSKHRPSRSGSGAFGPDSPRRKFSVQTSTNAVNARADPFGSDSVNSKSPPLPAQNCPTELIPASPRRETGVPRANSPQVFAHNGGVILTIGKMDDMVISQSIADNKPTVAVSTAGMAAFPRQRSRSTSHSSQPRRDQSMHAMSGKVDSTCEAALSSELQLSQPEASGSVFRMRTQAHNAPGNLVIPVGCGIPRKPFTARADAVTEAAANLTAPTNTRHPLLVQKTQHQLQQRTAQSDSDGTAISLPGKATTNIPPNFFITTSSLATPLMTMVSSKTPPPNASTNNIHLQLQETPEPHAARPQTPFGGLLGTSIPSPRASTAQVSGIFIAVQRPGKPALSPRPILVQRPGNTLSSEYQPPRIPKQDGAKGSSRIRQQPSSLASGTATSQKRLQRHPSGLAIEFGKIGL